MEIVERFYYLFVSWLDRKNLAPEIRGNKKPCEYVFASVFPDEDTMSIALHTIIND